MLLVSIVNRKWGVYSDGAFNGEGFGGETNSVGGVAALPEV
jgi:hypothetical protein